MTKPTDPSIGEAVEREARIRALIADHADHANRYRGYHAEEIRRRMKSVWDLRSAEEETTVKDLEALLSENTQLRERVGVLAQIIEAMCDPCRDPLPAAQAILHRLQGGEG